MSKGFSVRYHSMDALRWMAMMLGLVIHTGVTYSPHAPARWPRDPQMLSEAYSVVGFFIHAFRMELFFMMAGFFCLLLLEKIGWREFLLHRFKRIVLPLIVGWLLIFPTQRVIILFGHFRTKNPHAEGVGLAAFFEQLRFEQVWSSFRWMHLWFLFYLVCFYVLFFACSRFSFLKNMAQKAASFFPAVMNMKSKLLIFASVTTIPLMFMNGSTVDTSSSLLPEFQIVTYYLLFFAFGCALYVHRDLLEQFEKERKFYGWLALLFFTLALVIQMEKKAFFSQGIVGALSFRWFYAMCTWSLLLYILGLGQTHFSAERKSFRYLADASYWFYLVHLPLCLFLSVLCFHSVIPGGWRFFLVIGLTIALLAVSYHFLVRYSWIGTFLHGQKKKGQSLSKNVEPVVENG